MPNEKKTIPLYCIIVWINSAALHAVLRAATAQIKVTDSKVKTK